MFTDAVTVVGAPEDMDEIGISKIGIDVVSPLVVVVPTTLLLLLGCELLPVAAAAFFFFEPPDLPPDDDFPSFATGGETNPAATAWAFNSFCRFSACDFACFLRWSFR